MLNKFIEHLNRYGRKIINIIDSCLPNQCLLCQCVAGRVDLVCAECCAQLPLILNACKCCGVDLPAGTTVCGACSVSPPFYQQTFIPFFYREDMAFLIKQLKFQHQLVVARFLGETLAQRCDFLKTARAKPQCIIPVPLHAERLRERGFNQALEIARPISKKWRIPIVYDLCVRHRVTPSQSSLPAEERLKNVKNAFAVKKTHDYKHVAIIDDVITTGHTINEVARVLKNSGVEFIEVWGIARTPIQ